LKDILAHQSPKNYEFYEAYDPLKTVEGLKEYFGDFEENLRDYVQENTSHAAQRFVPKLDETEIPELKELMIQWFVTASREELKAMEIFYDNGLENSGPFDRFAEDTDMVKKLKSLEEMREILTGLCPKHLREKYAYADETKLATIIQNKLPAVYLTEFNWLADDHKKTVRCRDRCSS
jgi:hypothetical protein